MTGEGMEGANFQLASVTTLKRPSILVPKELKLKDKACDLDNEFDPAKPPFILKPLIKPDQGNWYEQKRQQELNDVLEKQYAYFSQTRDLEFNSPRTQILQNIVDKMTAGTGIASRIVILNKGETANAFVCPDGTVFVTQSALNKLDTEDEVAAIIGHELGHLIFDTSKYISMADNDLEKLGIAFAHEAASDHKSFQLLQKSGYNSFAFSSAIRKIQGSERGTVHMSGLSRASMNVGEHFAIDSSTSHQAEKPIPPVLHKELRKTNLEIITEASRDKAFQPSELRQMIEQLHLQDLRATYKLFWEKRENNYDFTKVLNELVINRLLKAGYSQEEAILMLYSNPSASVSYGPPEDCYLIDTPEKLNHLISGLQSFETNKTIHGQMLKKIFDIDISNDLPSATLNILQLISKHLYNSERNPDVKGIPVTGPSLISLLESLNQINLGHPVYDGQRTSSNTAAITKYINKTYLESFKGQISPGELRDLEQFLVLLNGSSVSFDKTRIANNYYNKPNEKESKDKDGRRQAVCGLTCRLLGVEINEETFDFKDIDDFFKALLEAGEQHHPEARKLAILIETINRYFRNNSLNDQDKVRFLNYFNEKIDSLTIKRSSETLRYLDKLTLPEKFGLGEEILETPEFRNAIMKFNLKTVLAMGLFGRDSDEFYGYLGPALAEFEQALLATGINPTELSRIQLINLCKNLFHGPGSGDNLFLYWENGEEKVHTGETYSSGISKASINDYDRFFKLPLIKAISGKEDNFNAANLVDLLSQADRYLKSLQFEGFQRNENFNLLADNALSLITGRAIVRNFEAILNKGINDPDLGNLYSFTNRYYPGGVEKDQLLRNINKRYLKSTEVTFEQKLDYLYQYGEQVGYEGVAIVVDQIEDMESYRVFRERLGEKKLKSYLESNSSITKVALADILSAEVVKNFSDLLKTCENDPVSMGSVSTWYGKKWLETVLGRSGPAINYDSESEKFILNDQGRGIFRSVADTFTKLQNLSQAQRFAIAHKALFETGGAFASPENRQILANALVSSLGIKQGFVKDILFTGAIEADAEYIGFPAANMVGSLLFRALNINSVDLNAVKNTTIYGSVAGRRYPRVEEVMTDRQILRNLNSTTREIILFGAGARKDPNSLIARMAEESDGLYYSVSAKLNQLLGEEAEASRKLDKKDYEIDPAMEAVIKGVESTGALGIRALQLATQFHNFSENMNRRLSETFDANPGMSRLVFWENLHQRAEENPQVEQFMQRIKLGRYLGGGSLQTTYAATFTSDTGETKEIIIKRKNPNVEGLLKKAYTVSRTVLDTVSKKKGTKESANHAKTGLMLIDLAQAWCIDDLNDRYYEEHDDLFRQTVDKFNQELGAEQFYVPKRVFTELKVKFEELAPGRTVNQVLKDDTVSNNSKKEIVAKLGNFFLYQLSGNSFIDEDGKKFFLIHSDPHVGNYMVDTSPDGKPGIGVIDRSLYLKLDENDVKVLEKLIGNSNPTDFVYSFINLVLDRNKDRGITRQIVTGRVFVEIAKEYQRQFVQGKVDKFALLRTLLGELSKQGREAPLELRLMIRNIGALQELMKKYGLVLK